MKFRYLCLFILPACLWRCEMDCAAQCSSASGATFMGTIIPAATFQSITGVNAGEYWNFAASPCTTYVFSFCTTDGGSASWDSQFTINQNTGAIITGAYADDDCGNQSYLEWTCTSAGTYRIFISRYNCLNSSPSSGTLVYKAVPVSTITSEYSLLGSATAPSGCAALTADQANNIGCAWDVNSTLDFNSAFSYDFTVNLGSSDGGADGICFVMQNDPLALCACGGSGGGMGATGITNSVIIELDTYLNYEDRDDGISGVQCSGGPNPDHIDLWLNGNVNPSGTCGSSPGARIIPSAVALMNGASMYNIENGADHILRISWIPSGATGTLTVSVLDNSGAVTYGTFSYSFNPSSVFGTTTPFFGFTASTGALSNQQSGCLSPMLLPVELASFTATCEESKSVLVQWETWSEFNNEYFSVERSSDGIQFTEVYRMPGAGTASSGEKYSWMDTNPLSGIAYYRLSDHAYNGNKTYSPAVSVSCPSLSSQTLSAFSDGQGNLLASMSGAGLADGLLRVISMNGSLVFSQQIAADQSMHASSGFFSGPLPEGIYLVTLNCRSGYYCTRLTVF